MKTKPNSTFNPLLFSVFNTSSFIIQKNRKQRKQRKIKKIKNFIGTIIDELQQKTVQGLENGPTIKKPIKIKKHGRKAMSFFRSGVNVLRRILCGKVPSKTEIRRIVQILFAPPAGILMARLGVVAQIKTLKALAI